MGERYLLAGVTLHAPTCRVLAYWQPACQPLTSSLPYPPNHSSFISGSSNMPRYEYLMHFLLIICRIPHYSREGEGGRKEGRMPDVPVTKFGLKLLSRKESVHV